MNLFSISNQSFNVAAVLYAIGFLIYCGQLVSNKKFFVSAASWTARAAFFAHTLALVVRWMEAGIGHPPWTNLYESLVFFSWGVMGVHLGLEVKMGFRITGVFATGVVFVAMGIASLHPRKEIEPLVPALQSWWLLFHVFMACIAYAFFLASSFVSVFYLLRDKVRVESMIAFGALVSAFFLCIASTKGFFNGKPLFGLSVAAYTLAALCFGAALWKKKSEIFKPGYVFYILSFGLHFALLVQVLMTRPTKDGALIKLFPYRVSAIAMTLGLTAFFLIVSKFKERILAKLPSIGVLDRWAYQSVLLGFPFMTINLISGAVWAYYAWGRYWGWDPKETWALITWFVYAFFLHARILGGWKGRPTAIISVVGFFIVIFTYLGVNLVISGLHSYATS